MQKCKIQIQIQMQIQMQSTNLKITNFSFEEHMSVLSVIAVNFDLKH